MWCWGSKICKFVGVRDNVLWVMHKENMLTECEHCIKNIYTKYSTSDVHFSLLSGETLTCRTCSSSDTLEAQPLPAGRTCCAQTGSPHRWAEGRSWCSDSVEETLESRRSCQALHDNILPLLSSSSRDGVDPSRWRQKSSQRRCNRGLYQWGIPKKSVTCCHTESKNYILKQPESYDNY